MRHFRRHADAFAQRRVRVDGLADIDGVGAHLDGQADFADHVAGARADDGAADDAMGFRVEDQLGEAVVGAVGDGATGGCPGELGDFDLAPGLLRLCFGQADPGDFGMCVGDAGDHAGVEVGLLACGNLGSDVRFMDGLVRQHGLADDVADGEDVRHVGAHLAVDRDEAALIDGHARLVGADLLAVRAAPGGLQDQVVALRFGRRLLTFERDPEAIVFRFDGGGFRLQHDLVEALGVLLFPDLDGIAVGALHQAVEHLDDIDAWRRASNTPWPFPGR